MRLRLIGDQGQIGFKTEEGTMPKGGDKAEETNAEGETQRRLTPRRPNAGGGKTEDTKYEGNKGKGSRAEGYKANGRGQD